jgi:DNA-binding winged helix-turn-helix (wHTH) protein/Tol biopolymer transport system component
VSFPRESCEEVAFGPFRFDPTSDSLRRGDEEVALQPRVLSLLSYLVANRGRVCGKNELLDNLWADSAVSQGSLSEAVKLLRQALGDDPRQPRYVQTVHRRGYRFIGATVDEAPADADASLQLPQPVLVGIAAVVVVVALIAIGAWVRNSPSDRDRSWEIAAPPETLMGVFPMDPYPALSPDGTKLALARRSLTGVAEIWVRDLGPGAERKIPETVGAEYPFWSPSGDRLAYRIDAMLWVVDIAGGSPKPISPVTSRGGSWSSASGILVPSADGLMLLAEDGSPQGLATRLDASRNETAHQHPVFLPDGRTFLYVATAADPADSGTWIASTETDHKKLLLAGPGAHNALYVAPGWLLSVRKGVLTAQRFDAQTWEFSGTPKALSGLMSLGSTARYAPFSANSDLLVFREIGRVNSELWWVDADGTPGETLPAIGVPGMYMSPSLSPTGTRLAAGFKEIDLNTQDVFVLDLLQGAWQQLTTTPNWDNAALWADESAVVLTSARSGRARPWIHKFAAAQPKPVGRVGWTTDVMPNGDLVQVDSSGLWLVPRDGGEPRLVTPLGAHAVQGRVSPDGRWLAYAGGPTSGARVFVKALFDDSPPDPVSPKEGRQPRWGRDGELYYLEPQAGTATAGSIETTVTRVAVTASGTRLKFGPAEPLFSFRHPILAQNVSWNYDVDPAGNRFLINQVSSETPGFLRAISNWQDLDLLLRR